MDEDHPFWDRFREKCLLSMLTAEKMTRSQSRRKREFREESNSEYIYRCPWSFGHFSAASLRIHAEETCKEQTNIATAVERDRAREKHSAGRIHECRCTSRLVRL